MCPSEVSEVFELRGSKYDEKHKDHSIWQCSFLDYMIATILNTNQNHLLTLTVAVWLCAEIWKTCSPQCTVFILGALLMLYLVRFPTALPYFFCSGNRLYSSIQDLKGGADHQVEVGNRPCQQKSCPEGKLLHVCGKAKHVWWEVGVFERHEGCGVWRGQADFNINL